jgi:hypothetical protein
MFTLCICKGANAKGDVYRTVPAKFDNFRRLFRVAPSR